MKNIAKRMIAAALSAATMLSSMAIVPTAGAADEDNKASSVEIKVNETYNIWDSGTQKAWFQQNGSPRNIWPMYTKASDGTMIRAYCADHSKTNPGSSGKPYTVTGKVADMHVYGVANLPRDVKGKKAQKKEKHDFREKGIAKQASTLRRPRNKEITINL